MNPSRVFRWLAVLNLLAGAAMVVLCFTCVSSLRPDQDGLLLVIATAVVLVELLIAGVMIHAAMVHLRHPTQQHALNLATNSSVIAFFLLTGLSCVGGLRNVIGPAYAALMIVPAYLIYALLLKPAALQGFPTRDAAPKLGSAQPQ
ncbi:hypothetical protein [Opitutus sp. ER46]|uniref:hypothetical protein n=1 Tax=Opitutus sp. ER46 TaxID=2161864 RepID=UPI000D2F88FB|nr:hypothetical protein [Opitutus sp. ER46]PTY01091.1 hypothetical protein DB354_00725 [Opitutus sp. ER46]